MSRGYVLKADVVRSLERLLRDVERDERAARRDGDDRLGEAIEHVADGVERAIQRVKRVRSVA